MTTTNARLTRQLAANLHQIEQRIDQACQRRGRSREQVSLIAVTKTLSMKSVLALIELGVARLGESRPQQLAQRRQDVLTAAPDAAVEWHMIGHLQRNKVDLLVPGIQAIHSVDSLRLFSAIAQRVRQLGTAAQAPTVLLEVNVTGAATKSGFTPAELRAAWPTIAAEGSLQVCGLMTMAEPSPDVETARPAFRALRELRDELQSTGLAGPQFGQLSMGMSDDFEVAIEEGATLVRIGSRLGAGIDEATA